MNLLIILKLDLTELHGLTQALKGADVTIVTFTYMENWGGGQHFNPTIIIIYVIELEN